MRGFRAATYSGVDFLRIGNGISHTIGLGTYGLTGQAGLEAMSEAIRLGYRHLDTAQTYGTEENVGQAVARSGRDRRDFFVTTKVTAPNLGRLSESLDDSLKCMKLDYVDLLLIHWPAPADHPPVRSYIGALARTQDRGKARLIGVSNFTRRHVDDAIAQIGVGRLATNQFEQHVFLQNRLLAQHCQDRGIRPTAYMPLAGGRVEQNPVLDDIASKHGVTANKVALGYLLARGSIVIPKSATPERQASNLAAADVQLDAEDMATLQELDRGERHINPQWGPDWD